MAGDRQRIAIFGGQGGAAVVAEYADASADIVGFLNDTKPAGEQIAGYRVLGGFGAWPELAGDVRFLAPLHKSKQAQARLALIEQLGVPDERWAVLVDPRAAIAPDVEIGHGCHVGPFAEIHSGTRVGRHVGVRGSAKISHDCVVDDFAFIGLNAVVCGYGAIGEGAHIAPQAAVLEGVRIGRFAVVGLGTVVLRDVADFAIVAGNPARQIGTVPLFDLKGA